MKFLILLGLVAAASAVPRNTVVLGGQNYYGNLLGGLTYAKTHGLGNLGGYGGFGGLYSTGLGYQSIASPSLSSGYVVSGAPAYQTVGIAAPAYQTVGIAAPAYQTVGIAAAPAIQSVGIAAAPAVRTVGIAAAPAIQTVAAAPAISNVAVHQQHVQHHGPVQGAVLSTRNLQVVDVPSTGSVGQVQSVIIGPSVNPVDIEFQSAASPVQARQTYAPSQPNPPQFTSNQEEPDYLKHEIVKPVIQEVTEAVQPYRRITQEIRPVQEEINQIVTRGQQVAVQQPFGVQAVQQQFVAQPSYAVAAQPSIAVAAQPTIAVAAQPSLSISGLGYGYGLGGLSTGYGLGGLSTGYGLGGLSTGYGLGTTSYGVAKPISVGYSSGLGYGYGLGGLSTGYGLGGLSTGYGLGGLSTGYGLGTTRYGYGLGGLSKPLSIGYSGSSVINKPSFTNSYSSYKKK